jgi:ankyrin repeat protein
MTAQTAALALLLSACFSPGLRAQAPASATLLESISQSGQKQSSGEALALIQHAPLLSEQGADVNARGTEGLTPLHWTVIAGMDTASRLVPDKHYSNARKRSPARILPKRRGPYAGADGRSKSGRCDR